MAKTGDRDRIRTYDRAVGQLGFSITAARAGAGGKDSRIRVHASLGRFGLAGMELIASSARAPLIDAGKLPEGLGWSIDDRLRHGGPRKGRVLAVWQGDTLIAACAWHLHETGPPVVFDLGARTDVSARTAKLTCTALLACLRDVGEALGRSHDLLRWSDRPLDRVPDPAVRRRYRGAVRARAAGLGFTPLRPRPKFWKGRWATERSF